MDQSSVGQEKIMSLGPVDIRTSGYLVAVGPVISRTTNKEFDDNRTKEVTVGPTNDDFRTKYGDVRTSEW